MKTPKGILEFLKQALTERSGKPSTMRISTAFASTLFIISLSFGFVYTVFSYEGLIIAYASILAGLLAGLLGIKSYQRNKENNDIH